MPEAEINGATLEYSIDGEGEPLLLIIGLGSDKSNWRLQVAEFKKRYRVITFNNRGTGRSSRASGPLTIDSMADDAAALLTHVGVENAHVLGVSMGGMIAQMLALRHPERVRRLILGCTFTRSDDVSGFTPEITAAARAYSESRSDERLRAAVNLILDATFNQGLYRALALSVMKATVRYASMSGVGEQLEAIQAFDASSILPGVKAPTLVIAGTGDRVIKPSSSRVIAGLIPGARLVMIEGGSHGFSGEMSREFNKAVLGFLEGG